ncbi:hypothetical protein AAGW05_03955 [Arthrobacter sp. LAPM80]
MMQILVTVVDELTYAGNAMSLENARADAAASEQPSLTRSADIP